MKISACFSLAKLFFVSLIFLANTAIYAVEAVPSATAIGKVIVASGEDIKAIEANKKVRELTRQSPIYQGDVIATGKDSRVQIRFLDDTSISMRPDSEIRIDNYKFDAKNEANNKNYLTLVQGGFRTLTGAMTKKDPEKYKLTTAVATIGIRGTDFSVVTRLEKKKTAVQNGQNLSKDAKAKQETVNGKKDDEEIVVYTTVWSGKTVLSNSAGDLVIGAGEKYQNAMITSSKVKPEGLLQTPDVITACPNNRRF